MSKQTEALKLALYVLDEVRSETFRLLRNGQKLYAEEKVWNAITAIREALAEQPAQQDILKIGCVNHDCDKCNAQQQEPVTWKDEQGNVLMTLDAGEIQSSVGYVYSVHGERIKNACIRSDIPNGTPLYTSPQPSKPLTDEQIAEIAATPCAVAGSYVHTFARAIEAAHGIKE